MKLVKLIAALAVGAVLSSCGPTTDVTSRNAVLASDTKMAAGSQSGDATQQLPSSLRVVGVHVNVPQTLSVSEADTLYPRGDIVWRGDAAGDRYKQVESIFKRSFIHGTKDFQGETPVQLSIQVSRFHSLSERASATVGGVHNMEFWLTVHHARTGEKLAPTRRIEANLKALGGSKAIRAVNRGQTQKVRVMGYLAQVIRQELLNNGASTRSAALRKTQRFEF